MPPKLNNIYFSKTVYFPIEYIYEVVSNVEEYPKILPYIKKSKIYNTKNNDTLQVEMKVRHGIVSFSYKCDVFLKHNKSIHVIATDGPFFIMRATWLFFKKNKDTTEIEYNLNYKFSVLFLEKAVSFLLKKNINPTIEAFENFLRKKYNL